MRVELAAERVLVVLGPAGRRPPEALRRCLSEAVRLRRLLQEAGTPVTLALALPTGVIAEAGLDDGSAEVFPQTLPAAADDSLEYASAVGGWLAGLGEHTSVHAIGWRAAVAAVAADRHTGAPVVAQVDQVPSWPQDAGFHSSRAAKLGWLGLAACDAVLLESVWAQDLAVANGVQRTRTVVAHPGVEVQVSCPSPRGSDAGTLRVLSVGAVTDVMSVRAVAEAARHVSGCELLIGRITGLDEPCAKQLQEALQCDAVTQRLGERLRVVPEPVDALCAEVDVVVDVSAQPGRGLGVLAGMVAARAVVATAVGGMAEMVVHRTTGLIVPPGAPVQTRDAVLEVLRDPFHREAYGEAGSDRVQAMFSAGRFIETVARVHVTTRPVAAGGGAGAGAGGQASRDGWRTAVGSRS